MKKMKTNIYILCDPDGKIRYVGKTSQTLEARICGHFSDVRRDVKSYKCNWIKSLFLKGYSPTISLVEEVRGNGNKEEIAWIKYFRSEGVDLVNTTDGGEGNVGYKATIETRKKISEALKGNQNSKGCCRSKEECNKISERLKARIITKGHPALGHHCSDEAKIKIGNANKGRYFSKKMRRNMSEAQKGNIKSKETCQKMSIAQKGKPWSKARRDAQLKRQTPGFLF